MFCSNCGAQLPNGSKFCTNCGSRLDLDQNTKQMPYQAQNVGPSYTPHNAGPAYPPPYGPQRSQKKSSPLVPIIIILIILLMIGGIVFAFFFAKSKIQSALNGTPLGKITGTIGGSSSSINIPKDAVKVTDATLYDLAGKYEGEMQITKLEGMDKVPGAEYYMDEVNERLTEILSEPCDCSLEIDEDGEWSIEFDAMGGLDMSSRDFSDDSSDARIQDLKNGIYTVNATPPAEEVIDNDGNTQIASGTVLHEGAYCNRDGKDMVAGHLAVNMNMSGVNIVLEGNFDVIRISDNERNSYDDNDYDYDRHEDYDHDSQESHHENDYEDNSSLSYSGDPSETALKGGKWEALQSGEFIYYDNYGYEVSDKWAEDEGGYYYLGLDGCLVRNNYSSDGYWVNEDGCWDRNIPKREEADPVYNHKYVGNTWIFEISMEDSKSGTGKWYYRLNESSGALQKTNLRIFKIGQGSYAAYDMNNESVVFLMNTTNGGNSIIVSADGETDTCWIE